MNSSGRNFLDGLPTTRRDLLRSPEPVQTVHGGLHQIMGVMRADTLGQYVMHPGRFQHGANSTTGNNPGTLNSGFQHYIPCAEFPENLMRDAQFGYGNTFHILTRLLNPFPDCLRHLIGFTETATNLSFSISHNNDGAEAETTPTFNYLRSSIDMNNLFNKLVIAARVLIKI